MTHSLKIPTLTPFGTVFEDVPNTTVFVFAEGKIYKNPEILEADEDVVVFLGGYDLSEMMGRAVALPFLTPEEAVLVAKRFRYHLVYNDRYFCWSRATRRRSAEWCAGFRKKRGSRTHLVPATLEQCVKLIEGTLKITYWTNSNRCDFVAA